MAQPGVLKGAQPDEAASRGPERKRLQAHRISSDKSGCWYHGSLLTLQAGNAGQD